MSIAGALRLYCIECGVCERVRRRRRPTHITQTLFHRQHPSCSCCCCFLPFLSSHSCPPLLLSSPMSVSRSQSVCVCVCVCVSLQSFVFRRRHRFASDFTRTYTLVRSQSRVCVHPSARPSSACVHASTYARLFRSHVPPYVMYDAFLYVSHSLCVHARAYSIVWCARRYYSIVMLSRSVIWLHQIGWILRCGFYTSQSLTRTHTHASASVAIHSIRQHKYIGMPATFAHSKPNRRRRRRRSCTH